MKNCICCLSLLILSSLVACSGSEESDSSKQNQLKMTNSTTRFGQVKEVVTSTSKDSVLLVEAAEKEKTIQLKLALESTKALKEAYDRSVEETEHYVESIPFTTFLGKPVDLGALEIVQFENQYTRVYADYFDGEPIGGKLFLIQNETLVAIEVIQLREKITENGAFIQDESTHILYYHEEVLLSMVNLATNEAIEESSIGWLDENLADWELVKVHINTL
ncbi:MAG: hypothetical protein JKY03_02875 [Aureispira sp.]|nr:hypothetical protein [Aureispira sp.]